jgi:hypothetical protein
MQTTRKIVIPTDFSVKSLSYIVRILEQAEDERLEIVLLHGVFPSDSISELLFTSTSSLLASLQTPEFIHSCNLIKNKFQSRIKAMYADVIPNNSRAYLANYLEANAIEEVYIPMNYNMNFQSKRSFDVRNILQKCMVPVTALHLVETEVFQPNRAGHIADLFFSKADAS